MEYTGTDTRPIGQPVAGSQGSSRPWNWRTLKDSIARHTLFTAAVLLILLLIAIGVVLARRPCPSWRLTPSRSWSPPGLAPPRGAFGLAPFIIGSFAVTLMAMVLGVVPAVLSGVYLAEYTTAAHRSMLKPVLDLLAGIPSVVYGLWGILFVVPLIREVIAPVLGSTLAGPSCFSP
ncbi:MAG: hypothetical protein R3C44_24640 [Chloroflexota bacterium]